MFDDNPNTSIAEVDVSYGYDLVGHMTSAGDQNGWGATWTWDALGRLVTQASNVATTGFQYDPAGRMTRQTWGDGFYVTYDYDPTGNPVAVRENGVMALATFGYDALGRRTGITRGNGTSTSYTYDAVSRLASFGHDLAGTSADLSVTFGYNPSGQIVSRTGSNDAYSWTGYANGTSGYTADGLNRYTAAGTVAPTYDARGNTTSAGGTTYGYNAQNQLYTTGTGGLWYRGPTGLLGQEPGVGEFDWVGDRLSTIQNSGIDRRYVYAPGEATPLVWYEGAGTTDKRWLHTDERGSVIAVSDGSGNPLAINRYDEYGQPASENLGRFGYTGQQWIAGLGLWDYKARMYSPALGRFMQTDPIGYGDGLNWYGYVGGDPINFVDPRGLDITVTGPSCPSGLTSQNAGSEDDPHYVCIADSILNYVITLSQPNYISTFGGASNLLGSMSLSYKKVGCNKALVAIGNNIADKSRSLADISADLTTLGTVGAIYSVFQPEALGPSLALIRLGSYAGMASSAAQVASGLVDWDAGAGSSNLTNGLGNVALAGVFTAISSPMIPKGYRTVRERASDAREIKASSVFGGVVGLMTSLLPTGAVDVSCPASGG